MVRGAGRRYVPSFLPQPHALPLTHLGLAPSRLLLLGATGTLEEPSQERPNPIAGRLQVRAQCSILGSRFPTRSSLSGSLAPPPDTPTHKTTPTIKITTNQPRLLLSSHAHFRMKLHPVPVPSRGIAALSFRFLILLHPGNQVCPAP